MIQTSGFNRTGIGKDGKPFSISMLNWAAYSALAPVIDAQNAIALINTGNVKTYNLALAQYDNAVVQTPASIPPVPHKPQMGTVLDYLSDATADNPIGTSAGEPVTQWVDFNPPLADPAPPPVTAPSAPVGPDSRPVVLSPVEAAMFQALGAIAGDVGAIRKKLGA